MKLRVHHIQRFCLHDGPGIRTTVFCQGCDLRCWWCHNPEMLSKDHLAASDCEPATLVEQLLRDHRYWRAGGGGVTISGGEPLLQAAAVAGLLALLKQHQVQTAIETAGCASADAVRQLLNVVDLWLWDIKTADAAAFADGCGGDAAIPLDNLALLLRHEGANVRLRVPLIRSFNDDEPSLKAILAIADRLPRAVPIDVLPGHDLGRPNAQLPSATPSEAALSLAREILQS